MGHNVMECLGAYIVLVQKKLEIKHNAFVYAVVGDASVERSAGNHHAVPRLQEAGLIVQR